MTFLEKSILRWDGNSLFQEFLCFHFSKSCETNFLNSIKIVYPNKLEHQASMESGMSEIYFYKRCQKDLYESIHADLGGTAEW